MPKVNKANCATRYLEQNATINAKRQKRKSFKPILDTKRRRSEAIPRLSGTPRATKKTVKENASYRNCSIAIHTFCNGYSMSYIFVVLVNF